MKSVTTIIHLIFLVMLFSCAKKKEGNTTSVINPINGGGGPTASPTPGGGSTTGSGDTTAQTCAGDTSDGDNTDNHSGFNYPLHIHQIGLSGKVSWLPGLPAFRPEDKPYLTVADANQCFDYGTGCAQGSSNKCYYCLKGAAGNSGSNISVPFSYPNPLKKDSWDKFNNDGDVFIRIKLRKPSDENINGVGGAYCYGRLPVGTNKNYVPYTVPYTKIKVDVYARVLRKTTNCDVHTNCTENDFTYTATKLPVKMGMVLEVDKCSPIIRIPVAGLINTTSEAVAIEIGNVFTNSPCLEAGGKGAYCPFYQLNTQNCWFGTLELATNETQFFKGKRRSEIP